MGIFKIESSQLCNSSDGDVLNFIVRVTRTEIGIKVNNNIDVEVISLGFYGVR